jgi:hypothetical protein
MQLLIFFVLSLAGLGLILWESRPRQLQLCPLPPLSPGQSEPADSPRDR